MAHHPPSPAPALGVLTAAELEHACERRRDHALRDRIADVLSAVTGLEMQEALAEAHPVAPACPTCLGTGWLEVIVGGVHSRTIDCYERGCCRGLIEQAWCFACGAERTLPDEDASPHFCSFLATVDQTGITYLCPDCRRNMGAHLSGCRS